MKIIQNWRFEIERSEMKTRTSEASEGAKRVKGQRTSGRVLASCHKSLPVTTAP